MGNNRVIIENVQPQIDCGAFPIKRTPGEAVEVAADIFTDGHAHLFANLLWKDHKQQSWSKTRMRQDGNDRWSAAFTPEKTGAYVYTIAAGIDPLSTWYADLVKKWEANLPVANDLEQGRRSLEALLPKTSNADQKTIEKILQATAGKPDTAFLMKEKTRAFITNLFSQYCDEEEASLYEKELNVEVSRTKARFSAWYERFPRSTSKEPGKGGTLKDCAKLLPEVARMGFDVFYLPPIHPIGRKARKGKNNQVKAGKQDPGSPWAIGSNEGGHDAVHPQLGTLDDYRMLLQEADGLGIEIAFDLAFQCSPDHPYVKERPEWFLWQPDGTVRYAENPPKKYEDIVPFHFECKHWKALWEELKRVVLFWCEAGVRVFRVDNPHTKPFAFWQWLIKEVKEAYPSALFLSEAFTRPKVMHYLAKIGFDQSYTYFTWRNTKEELERYFLELAQGEGSNYLRPNFWPNTPDILPQSLQYGERPAFIARLILAATASSNYGIYGPCFENMVNLPLKEGSEEYLNSEKYEIVDWDPKAKNLREFIALVNAIRKENPALHYTRNLQLIQNDNPFLISYLKCAQDLDNAIIVVVNLDMRRTQSGWLSIPADLLAIPADKPYLVEDLLSGDRYLWQGEKAYVELNPRIIPAHLFKVRKTLIQENQFDYYM